MAFLMQYGLKIIERDILMHSIVSLLIKERTMDRILNYIIERQKIVLCTTNIVRYTINLVNL